MSRGIPRCRICQAPVVFFRMARGGHWRKFDAKPVDGRTHQGAPAYPVDGERAWTLAALTEDLMARREVGLNEAEHEAYDMPWYVPHSCPPNSARDANDTKAEETS